MRYLTSDGDLPLQHPLTPLKQHHGELFDPQWGFTTPKFPDTLNPLSQWAIGPPLRGFSTLRSLDALESLSQWAI